MMSLTELNIHSDIEKSHKYIRREWVNGRWRYWYEDPKGQVRNGRFGRILKEYVGNPSGAFKRLFRDKRGQAFDVVTVRVPAVDIGDDGKVQEVRQSDGKPTFVDVPLDLVWGSSKEGLFHILLRHFVQQHDFKNIADAEEKISSSLKRLETHPDEFSIKFDDARKNFQVVGENGIKFVISIEQNKDSSGSQTIRHFILTSYDTDPASKWNPKKTMNENYEQIKRKEY